MDNCVDYNAIQLNLSDESDNETGSDASDSSITTNSQATESCTLIRNNHANQTNVIYRRISNYMGDTRFLAEYGNFQIFSTHKSTRQHKSLKRFLFLFGFASTLIILSQLYLSLYFDGSSFGLSLSGWDQNRSRSIPFYILPDVNTTILEPPTLCREDSPILLLIVICSSADNFEIRQTLRETWANTSEFNYSKFSTLHSHFKGKYLSINYANWRNFTVKYHHKESSPNVNNNISDSNKDEPSHVDFQIRTVFLVGQTDNNDTQDQIVEESRMHNDLIQESFLDTYNNLTLKTVMMLKWINNNCAAGKVKFIMKCDDDTFVNVPNLIHFLLGGTVPIYNATFQRYNVETVRILSPKNRLTQHDDLLIGTRFCKSKPISDFRSKWFTPRYMYDKRIYPNYLSGAGYVLTMDTAEKLYNVSMTTSLLHLEDVYLTGICAERAGIKPQNHHLFNYLPYKDLCEVRGMITLHEIKSNEMRKAYDFIMKSNVTCPAPNRRAIVRPVKKTKSCCS